MPTKGIKKAKCQKKITIPDEKNPLYRFYVTLYKQNPQSTMAINWLIDNGVSHMVINLKKLKL